MSRPTSRCCACGCASSRRRDDDSATNSATGRIYVALGAIGAAATTAAYALLARRKTSEERFAADVERLSKVAAGMTTKPASSGGEK